MKAMRFATYGDVDVLDVVEVPGTGGVLVRLKAARINPSRPSRKGALHERWPATFPSGEGSDLAGIVEETGGGVERWRAGDEVIGFTNNRATHAELVIVPAANPTPRPSAVPWDAAGALHAAGATAWPAVRAAGVFGGDMVVLRARREAWARLRCSSRAAPARP